MAAHQGRDEGGKAGEQCAVAVLAGMLQLGIRLVRHCRLIKLIWIGGYDLAGRIEYESGLVTQIRRMQLDRSL